MEYRNIEARCACSAEIDFVWLSGDGIEPEEVSVARDADVAFDDFVELESGSVFWSFADFVALIGRRDIQRVVNGNARPILTDSDEVLVWLPRNENHFVLIVATPRVFASSAATSVQSGSRHCFRDKHTSVLGYIGNFE